MEITLNELLVSEEKFYLVSGRERDVDIFKHKDYNFDPKTCFQILRGKRCTTKESLFQEFAAALQFPYYFGHNWDAFDECINDLSWLPANNYILFITNFNKVLINNPRDLSIFMNILRDTIPNMFKKTRNNIPDQIPATFSVIFHCESENMEKCKETLKREGIRPILRNLKPFDNIE